MDRHLLALFTIRRVEVQQVRDLPVPFAVCAHSLELEPELQMTNEPRLTDTQTRRLLADIAAQTELDNIEPLPQAEVDEIEAEFERSHMPPVSPETNERARQSLMDMLTEARSDDATAFAPGDRVRIRDGYAAYIQSVTGAPCTIKDGSEWTVREWSIMVWAYRLEGCGPAVPREYLVPSSRAAAARPATNGDATP